MIPPQESAMPLQAGSSLTKYLDLLDDEFMAYASQNFVHEAASDLVECGEDVDDQNEGFGSEGSSKSDNRCY